MLLFVNLSLYLHIFTGALALLVGLLAMLRPKRRGPHTKLGNIYFWLMNGVCITAVILSISNWERSSYLLPIAIVSYLFSLSGYRAAKIKNEKWLKRHIRGMLGSYIALVTAFLVVSGYHIPVFNLIPKVLLWILPTIIGTLGIIVVQKKRECR